MERKWVVFDVMGVIFEVGDHTNELLVPFVRSLDPTISALTVQEMYRRASLGEFSSADFWSQLGFASRYPETEHRYLNSSFSPDPEFSDVAATLRTKYHLAILSNDVTEWGQYLQRKHDLDRFFEVVLISSEIGCRKPDRKAFEILLERLHTSASNCVFVDDKRENLQAAAALFIRTALLRRHGKTNFPHASFEIECLSDLPLAVARVFG